jgi:hypothetical protein
VFEETTAKLGAAWSKPNLKRWPGEPRRRAVCRAWARRRRAAATPLPPARPEAAKLAGPRLFPRALGASGEKATKYDVRIESTGVDESSRVLEPPSAVYLRVF